MIWLVWTFALAVGSFYIGAVMATGRWNPWKRPAQERRWTCVQPGCSAEALPRGGKSPGSPFCPEHSWDTYHVAGHD